MSEQVLSLPCSLGDGLILRWATPADTEELAEFNARLHGDENDPAHFLAAWTRDLMSGEHPTTQASDFTVVVDENTGGKIVSSMNLISQTWAYDGVTFPVGRPELVATDADYRRRGLVRLQFDAIHAKSAARGELVQGITGINWYYRQFGYEMCVNLDGGRRYYLLPGTTTKEEKEEPYRLRPAIEADVPLLMKLYERNNAGSLLTRVRDEAQWRFEGFQANRDSPYARRLEIVETAVGESIGYIELNWWAQAIMVRETAVLPGHSLRAVALYLTRALARRAPELSRDPDKPINRIFFGNGPGHPIYEALENELERERPPYAWYIRVPNLPAFLRHIAPVLEKRLANSVMAGHTGALRLNFFRSQLALKWENGRLQAIEPYKPSHHYDSDAMFPDLTFLQLLFGHRSLDELDYAFADVYPQNGDARTLLKILFPKQNSWLVPLG